MIHGLGIDAVEINRFMQWHTFKKSQLARIFSSNEITYCLKHRSKSAERFAVRFAAKEAFFKAWNSISPTTYAPFLTWCRAVSIEHDSHNAPRVSIKWELLPPGTTPVMPLVSLTHTDTTAIACILLQNYSN